MRGTSVVLARRIVAAFVAAFAMALLLLLLLLLLVVVVLPAPVVVAPVPKEGSVMPVFPICMGEDGTDPLLLLFMLI